ncbi:hypothetical protein FPZ12_044895 [Amycolatopsis acidicola]|uniref:Helix-hairpin-helix domain-containing protein n=1 Tax=Amycolatopsis acidicola TaxID=2596893 RepID=A0A5N0ULQ9_9PSEU|nr:hypothetical protein [Amycolatopsis acidicola]KAA9148521.1 hypothetical protein FPZ12_044895 [Amycolatopsis acidicola]
MTSRNGPVRVGGRWYYVVLVGTAGLFAWVPFLHAAIRSKAARARRFALLFAALDALMYVLLVITPQDANGQVVDSPISTIGGLLALTIIVLGCVLLGPARRLAHTAAPPEQPKPIDPAIQAVLDARARRDEARKLAADDPLLARELHIGRPNVGRTYDDGGLVDLNHAPAATIAEVCDLPGDVAAALVSARENRGEPFFTVDEFLISADVPVTFWDRIRDRAILLG